MKTEDTILIGFNAARGDDGAFIVVGRKNPKTGVSIINTICGEEAVDIYKRLVTKKENVNEEVVS